MWNWRAASPSLALGGGAGVIAITPIAAANLGRGHGAAARPAKEQALQQCRGRRAFRSRPPRPVLSQERLDFLPRLAVDDRGLFAGMDLVAIAHLANVGDVGQQPVQAASGKGSATMDAAFTGLRLLGTPTPPSPLFPHRQQPAMLQIKGKDGPNPYGLFLVDHQLLAGRIDVVSQDRQYASPFAFAPCRRHLVARPLGNELSLELGKR